MNSKQKEHIENLSKAIAADLCDGKLLLAEMKARDLAVYISEMNRELGVPTPMAAGFTYVQAQPQPRLELDARAVDEVVRRLAGIVEERVKLARPLLEHIERRQGDLANEVFKLAELIRAPRKSTAADWCAVALDTAIAAGRDQTAPGVNVLMTGAGGGGALASAKATPYAPKAAGGPVARQPNEPAPRRRIGWWECLQALFAGLGVGWIIFVSTKAIEKWPLW